MKAHWPLSHVCLMMVPLLSLSNVRRFAWVIMCCAFPKLASILWRITKDRSGIPLGHFLDMAFPYTSLLSKFEDQQSPQDNGMCLWLWLGWSMCSLWWLQEVNCCVWEVALGAWRQQIAGKTWWIPKALPRSSNYSCQKESSHLVPISLQQESRRWPWDTWTVARGKVQSGASTLTKTKIALNSLIYLAFLFSLTPHFLHCWSELAEASLSPSEREKNAGIELKLLEKLKYMKLRRYEVEM